MALTRSMDLSIRAIAKIRHGNGLWCTSMAVARCDCVTLAGSGEWNSIPTKNDLAPMRVMFRLRNSK